MSIDPAKSVFISYRRAPSQDLARLIRNELIAIGYNIFLDVENIGAGEFEKVILTEIRARPHFLFLIKTGSLERCQDQDDWLRRECIEAQQHERNIIPVIDEGISPGDVGKLLPADMQFLLDLNMVQLHSTYWDAAIERLDRYLKKPTNVALEQRTHEQIVVLARKQELVEDTAANPVEVDPLAAYRQIADNSRQKASEQVEREAGWAMQYQKFRELCADRHFPADQQQGALRKICDHFQVSYPADWQPGKLLTYQWVDAELQFSTRPAPFTNSLGMPFLAVPDLDNVLFCQWPTRVLDYAAFAAENPGVDMSWKGYESKQGATHPVIDVSWEDATAFCQWLSQRDDNLYRLPTDHEWSVAVGLGDQEDANASPRSKDSEAKEFPWGEQWPAPKGYGNFIKAAAFTTAVGSYNGDHHGLKDLSGNVWEWCQDWYDSEKEHRVLRGGSWRNREEVGLRSSCRGNRSPTFHSIIIGFRCVCVVG